MKLTALLIMFALLQVKANVYSQITLKEKKASIEKVIHEIERQTDYVFFYKSTLKNIDLNIDLKNASILTALEACFKGLPLSYKIVDKTIVVTETKESKPAEKVVALVQQIEIRGKVTDSAGTPLIGATVKVKGSTNDTFTDNEGNYLLKLSADDKVLVYSFIGMKVKEVMINNRRVINVTLDKEVLSVDEVVITGFFAKKKSSFTGSSVTFTGEQLKAISPTNLFQALTMVTPGLVQVENKAAGSNPNQLPELLIRGVTSFNSGGQQVNQPLIIRDGTIISMQDLYDMNINEIATVTILRDASAAALYGARAANGVIVIERNRITDGKMKITYNLTGSVQFPDFRDYDLLNPKDKLEYERLAGLYTSADNTLQYPLDSLYNERYKDISKGVFTDWMAKPSRVGYTLDHSLRLAGGAGSTRYELNGRYGSVEGVMKGDYRKRYGIGFALEYYMPNGLNFTNRTSFSQVGSKASPYGIFSQYTEMNPYDRSHDEFGNLIPILSYDIPNPLYEAELGSFAKNMTQSFSNDFDARWTLSDRWRVTSHWNITLNNGNAESYVSPLSGSFIGNTDLSTKGLMQITNNKGITYSGNLVVSYNKIFENESLISVNAGGNLNHVDLNMTSFTGIGFYSDALRSVNFAASYPGSSRPDGTQDLNADVGGFLNLNYTYKNRYYFDGVYQISGSSKFGANNRYGHFWSAGLGWNLHNEEFLKNDWLDLLKLRGSAGYTGKVTFASYQALTTYRYNNTLEYLNGIGAVPITIGNPDLKWERTMNYNAGLDASFFKRWFNLTLDVYKRVTKDLLIDKTIAPSAGVVTTKDNLGEINNEGIELHMDSYLIKGKGFNLQAGVNASHNRNKILKISSALQSQNDFNNGINSTAPLPQYEEGESTTALKVVPSAGIDPATGKEIFIKLNGDRTFVFDPADKVVIGDLLPKISGSFYTIGSYKRITAAAYFSFAQGQYVYNTTRATKVEGSNPIYNADYRVFSERWKKPGDVVGYRDINDQSVPYQTTRFVEKENTLTLSRLNFSYEFAQPLVKRLGMSKASVGVSINDLFRASTVRVERGTSYLFSRGMDFNLNVLF